MADMKDYINRVIKATEIEDYAPAAARIALDPNAARLFHASWGLAGEAGEIADALRSHYIYGRPFDRTNLVEELGDMLFFMGMIVDTLGVSFEEVLAANEAKLRARYGEKFNVERYAHRDLEQEKGALEKAIK